MKPFAETYKLLSFYSEIRQIDGKRLARFHRNCAHKWNEHSSLSCDSVRFHRKHTYIYVFYEWDTHRSVATVTVTKLWKFHFTDCSVGFILSFKHLENFFRSVVHFFASSFHFISFSFALCADTFAPLICVCICYFIVWFNVCVCLCADSFCWNFYHRISILDEQ